MFLDFHSAPLKKLITMITIDHNLHALTFKAADIKIAVRTNSIFSSANVGANIAYYRFWCGF